MTLKDKFYVANNCLFHQTQIDKPEAKPKIPKSQSKRERGIWLFFLNVRVHEKFLYRVSRDFRIVNRDIGKV